jgi:ATP-binding cassette subfamily B protein
MIEKFSKCKNIIKKETKETLSKISFKAFLYSGVLFCFMCVLYIAKEDYVLNNLLNISPIADLFFFSLFTFIISFCSFIKYVSSKRIVIDFVENAQIEDNPEEKKKLSGNNLFIAFHNVCFQNPTIISDKLLINNLSFSVLPGEFVAITGESSYVYAKYIFELLLKYYKLQSGAIYLSGTKLESIKKSSVRKLISIFKLDFGLISGTVYENLELASYAKEPAKIERIAEKFGLLEDLDLEIYDEKGKLCISQEVIIRIQLARIYMQKSKIVLIETPDYFENEFAEIVFSDFVKNISKRKTTLILTDDIKTLVYANKVLYIGENESYFGTPAELSRVDSYGRYLSMLKRN